MITKKAENFLPESNPGYWAEFPSSVPTELRTHNEKSIQDVYKLNFGKVSPTNQINERKVLRSACSAAGARCAPCAAGDARRAGYRCGRRAVRCADCLRCDALRCAARGLVAFARCAVMHGMRRPMRCELVVMRCELFAMQCAARGAGGAMLLTEGFLGWEERV